MENEFVEAARVIGTSGVWGIVVYKALSIIGDLATFVLIGWGIVKGWPHFTKFFHNF